MTAIAAMTEVDDLALARLLADAADRISLDLYRDAELLVVTKPDRTEVSEADRAVEAALRRLLRTHRPEQGVLGGERGTGGSRRVRWLLDPVDATSNFVRGVDWWATLLALEIDGRVEVAMISAPAMGRRWWATRGQGAWTTGPLDPSPRPLAVSRVDDLAGAHLAYGDLRLDPWFADLAGRCWRARGIGDFLMFCLLAEGAVDVAVGQNDERAWELAAPVLLVTEAGGCVTDLAGRPWTEGQVAVASNRLLHAAVLAATGAGGARPATTRPGPRQLSPAPSLNPDTRDGSRAAACPDPCPNPPDRQPTRRTADPMPAAPDRARRLDDAGLRWRLGDQRHPSVAPSQGAPGLPRLPDHLLDALVTIARVDGRLHRYALRHDVLAGLLGRDLVAGCGHDLVELTPLGLRVVASVGLERIQQQTAARRGRVRTGSGGQVRWAG